MSEFNVGDVVVCFEELEIGFKGKIGVITKIRDSRMGDGTIFHVKFDCDPEEKEWHSHRFIHADHTVARISPICRKIRQLEERFQVWQERKAHAMV